MNDAKVKGRSSERAHRAPDGRVVADDAWFAHRYHVRRAPPLRDRRVVAAERAGLMVACRRVAFADSDEEIVSALAALRHAVERWLVSGEPAAGPSKKASP